jgi:cyclophilin family peptidyl-prolyl cis-trans isomerase
MKKTVLICFSALLVFAACKQKATQNNTTDTVGKNDSAAVQPEPVPQDDTTSITDSTKEQQVVITTAMGKIVLKLYNETPRHRDNFIKLVKDGFYTNLLFHRVMPTFMIQGGDPDSKTAKPGQQLGTGDLGYTVAPEIMPTKYIHKRGALSAARKPDQVNPQKNSSACQFYIVHGEKIEDDYTLQSRAAQKGFQYTPEQLNIYKVLGGTPNLDNDYTVFGEVVSGLEVVDIIAKQQCDVNNRPFSDIKFSIKMAQ